MRIFTTILIIFTSLTMYGQDHYFITAENGLNVRAGSNLSSKKVAKIPFGMLVEKIADTENELVISDNEKQIKGKFVKIKYNNYPYLVSEEKETFKREGYVFDGYLKKQNNINLVAITQIDKEKYAQLSQKVSKETHKLKAIRNLDSIKTILKNRVAWVSKSDIEVYERDDVLESIITENGQKLTFNQSSIDFGFSEGYSGYYPEYDILVLEGGHNSDVCFSIKTGETEQTIGNPEYIIASPKNSYRLNGFFGGQECYSYFIQRKTNNGYNKIIQLDEAFEKLTDAWLCTIGEVFWLDERTLYLEETNLGEKSEFFKIEIND